jgi:SNF2 family DNA or RNA helicase
MEYRKHWSSKVCKMLETLEGIHASSPGAKVIVFSQWDSLRGHVSQALCDRNVKHLILDGSIFDRSRTLEQFRLDPTVSLLLLSLEDSASGTNLTVASHVFLLHPMLAHSQAKAASFEAQAVGRVRRLGQSEPVHVWRFITAGTVEEELYEANTANRVN